MKEGRKEGKKMREERKGDEGRKEGRKTKEWGRNKG